MEQQTFIFDLSLSGTVKCATIQEAQMFIDMITASLPVPVTIESRLTDIRIPEATESILSAPLKS